MNIVFLLSSFFSGSRLEFLNFGIQFGLGWACSDQNEFRYVSGSPERCPVILEAGDRTKEWFC
jgi:hypothetical protein